MWSDCRDKKIIHSSCFQLPPDDIASHTLRMSIYDVDKKRLRHCLGHVSLPLNEADLSDNEIRWGDLEAQPQVGDWMMENMWEWEGVAWLSLI